MVPQQPELLPLRTRYRVDAAQRSHLGLPSLRTGGIDRDINAARIILQAGKAILAGANKLHHHEQATTELTRG